jgi:hypothetical protein
LVLRRELDLTRRGKGGGEALRMLQVRLERTGTNESQSLGVA